MVVLMRVSFAALEPRDIDRESVESLWPSGISPGAEGVVARARRGWPRTRRLRWSAGRRIALRSEAMMSSASMPLASVVRQGARPAS